MEKIAIVDCGSPYAIIIHRLIEATSSEIGLVDFQNRVMDTSEKFRDTFETMKSFELLADVIPQPPSIDQLKKQIKYSKNPLEVKMLNKKLNETYKDMKRR